MGQIGPIRNLAIDRIWWQYSKDYPGLVKGLKELMVEKGGELVEHFPSWFADDDGDSYGGIGGFEEDFTLVDDDDHLIRTLGDIYEEFDNISQDGKDWIKPVVRVGRWIKDDSFRITQ